MAIRRIDKLTAGTSVKLRFHGSKRLGNEPGDLKTRFLNILGEGDDRCAVFEDVTIYRHKGQWVYGTSAEKVTFLGVA